MAVKRMKEKRHRIRRGTPVERRTCAVCGELYLPWWVEQQTCQQSCARVLGGRGNREAKTARLLQVIQARREAKRLAIQADCRERWPDMTKREMEIANFFAKLGYKRGYSKAISGQTSARRSMAGRLTAKRSAA